MTDAMAALGIAVAATSAICYALLIGPRDQAQSRRPATINRRRQHSGRDDWAVASWFGGDHSATDSSGNPSDFSGGDSGGGDGGGGEAVAATIERSGFRKKIGILIYRNRHFLDSFQVWLGGQFGIA